MTRPPGYGLDPDSPCDEVINYKVAGSRGVSSAQVRVTVVTGPEAERLEKRQNEAIIELLKWAADHREELEAAQRKPSKYRITQVDQAE
jgi:hypothetical protein